MLFCLGQGLRSGPRAALAADAGVSVGVLVHALAGGLGLAALVAAWPSAFEVIRWFGVAYLLWVAWRALRDPLGGGADATPRRAARAFRDGLATNLSNPKVLLFMLALLPQFVRPEAGPILPQFLALGAVLSLGALVVNGAVGLMAGGIGGALARSPRLERVMRAVTASLFAALALRLALEKR
jgi:threonine/homoserine/homoserine lactone efflux protein